MHKIFLTGCDKNTEWQLPWFLENYRKHNNTPIVLADFGMSKEAREVAEKQFDLVISVISEAKGWFKKPRAILDATQLDGIKKVCWLDTDCEVTTDISDIFDLSEQGKLGMVKDRPWSTRRNELGEWYNSGVVLVENTPNVLKWWADECIRNPVQGDQEVLYLMMDGDALKKMSYIAPIPHTYNTLRLDYIDNIQVKNPKIIHHTGEKGNAVIKMKWELNNV
jgi:hypothetical protein